MIVFAADQHAVLPIGIVDPGDQAGKACSYCSECGSWGNHEFECVSCGFDFRSEPGPLDRLDDMGRV